jgi:hypothetical protein
MLVTDDRHRCGRAVAHLRVRGPSRFLYQLVVEFAVDLIEALYGDGKRSALLGAFFMLLQRLAHRGDDGDCVHEGLEQGIRTRLRGLGPLELDRRAVDSGADD